MSETAAVSWSPLRNPEHILLHDISWVFYEQLLHELGNRPIRATFDRGSLEISLPFLRHERLKAVVRRITELLALELRVPLEGYGSTTFRRADMEQGLDPDECFYSRNAERVRHKKYLNLPQDPPPDLAIEVDIGQRSMRREPIFASLGFPELWRFDGQRLTILRLQSGGQYEAVAQSDVFPSVPVAMIGEFACRLMSEDQLSVFADFRKWISTLQP